MSAIRAAHRPGSENYKPKALTPPIGRIPVRIDQKWYVVMLCIVINFEYDCYLRIERIDSERTKVSVNVEHETVGSGRQRFLDQEEGLDTPVVVGPCVAQLRPTLVGVLRLQTDCDAFRRRASRCVKNVGGDCAHKRWSVVRCLSWILVLSMKDSVPKFSNIADLKNTK